MVRSIIMATFCFDIDGTLCSQEHSDYMLATPYKEQIRLVNELFDQGHIIKIFTARGSESGIDWSVATKAQILRWGLKHHELILGKPHADFYIDDKAVNADEFSWDSSRLD